MNQSELLVQQVLPLTLFQTIENSCFVHKPVFLQLWTVILHHHHCPLTSPRSAHWRRNLPHITQTHASLRPGLSSIFLFRTEHYNLQWHLMAHCRLRSMTPVLFLRPVSDLHSISHRRRHENTNTTPHCLKSFCSVLLVVCSDPSPQTGVSQTMGQVHIYSSRLNSSRSIFLMHCGLCLCLSSIHVSFPLNLTKSTMHGNICVSIIFNPQKENNTFLLTISFLVQRM